MEEKCWEQFWKTGIVEDYLTYRNNCEREESRESDYGDGDGVGGITYRGI